MCVVSMIYDEYQPRFPVLPPAPIDNKPIDFGALFVPQVDLKELARLIAEFKEALEAAKTVDRLTGQPDCEDPEKVKLLVRVAELEALVKRSETKKVYVVRYDPEDPEEDSSMWISRSGPLSLDFREAKHFNTAREAQKARNAKGACTWAIPKIVARRVKTEA